MLEKVLVTSHPKHVLGCCTRDTHDGALFRYVVRPMLAAPGKGGARLSAQMLVRLHSSCWQVNKQTSELVFDHLHATAFQYSPLGRTILGPVENIKSLTRDQLSEYMATHYRGPRMVGALVRRLLAGEVCIDQRAGVAVILIVELER
jgi:hypothetical protein